MTSGAGEHVGEGQGTAGLVRASWFRGYVEGNALIPQTKNILVITTLEPLLRDPPSTWSEFGRAELSTKQLEALGRYMTSMHKVFGIDIVDMRHHEPLQQTVLDWRLQDLWIGTKHFVYFTVLNYINSTLIFKDRCYLDARNGYQRNNAVIDRFFSNQGDPQPAARFKAIIAATRTACFSVRAKEIAAVYRSTFQVPSPTTPLSKAGLFEEIERIRRQHPGKSVREAAHDEFCAYVRSVAVRHVPAFEGNAWYSTCLDSERLIEEFNRQVEQNAHEATALQS